MADMTTCDKVTAGSRLTTGSLTVSTSRMMLVPPRRFSRILISRLIFFFLTGCWLKMYNNSAHLYVTKMRIRLNKRLQRYKHKQKCFKNRNTTEISRTDMWQLPFPTFFFCSDLIPINECHECRWQWSFYCAIMKVENAQTLRGTHQGKRKHRLWH